MQATSNVISMGNRTTGFNGGPIDRGDFKVSVDETLHTVAEIEATTRFYDLFTEWTGIEVGSLGRVNDLKELQCPDFFIAELYRELWRLYDDSRKQQQYDSVALAFAVTTGRFIADELVCKHGARLVDAALAQLSSHSV